MKISKLMYGVTAILWLITVFIGYGDVRENLDGWHNFSGGHAIVFVLLCVVMVILCVYNLKILADIKVAKQHYIIGSIVIIAPFLFHVLAVNLQGNVETDFQYLILRTFQGFDYTYIWLIVMSAASFISLMLSKKTDKE